MIEPYKPLSNEGFSLVPAIFVPFHGLPKGKPVPKDRDEKLRRILEDLDKHQDSVRRNMIYLATLQKEKLESDARDALQIERAREESSNIGGDHESRDPELEQDIKELLQSLTEPAVRGTSGKEYEYQEGDLDALTTGPVERIMDADDDVAMGGMGDVASRQRNIHYELNAALQDLVTGTAFQIEMYDRHAEATKDYYQRALERHNVREGMASGSTAAIPNIPPRSPAQERRPGGILRHTSSEIRIDTEALSRMAKDDQNSPPNQQVHGTIDASKDPRRGSVDSLREQKKNSVQFAQDPRKPPMDGSRDVWRR